MENVYVCSDLTQVAFAALAIAKPPPNKKTTPHGILSTNDFQGNNGGICDVDWDAKIKGNTF